MQSLRLLLLLLSCFFILSSPQQAYSAPCTENHEDGSIDEIPSIREAQIIIEKQKVLLQQSAKSFVGLALNSKVPEFFVELDSSRALFEQNLLRIEAFVPNTPLQSSCNNIRQAWNACKVQLKKEIDLEEAEKLLKLNDDLTNACSNFSTELREYVERLLPEVATSLRRMDELSMKAFDQSVLTQEYMLYYFVDKLGASRSASRRLKIIEKSFEDQMIQLMDAAENSADVDKQLYRIKTQWEQLKKSLADFQPQSRAYMSQLATNINIASDQMSSIAQQYHQLSEVMSVSHLINLASLHRAHTQELTKYFTLATFEIGNSGLIKKDIQNSLMVFESRIQRILLFAPNEKIQRSATTVARFWKNYKQIIESDFSEQNLFKLIEQSHILMAACDQISVGIEDYSETLPYFKEILKEDENISTSTARVVNLAGRQCMDIQRIPIYFVLLNKNQGGSTIDGRFKEATNQFENTLTILREAAINTPEMEDELMDVEEAWMKLKNGAFTTINQQDNNRLETTVNTMNTIYKQLLAISNKYAKEMNQVIERKLRK